MLFFAIFLFVCFPHSANAVVPPDFIFNIGSQIAQIFGIIVLFFSTIFGIIVQFFRARFGNLKHKWLWVLYGGIIILGISFGIAYKYSFFKQKQEYNTWLVESEQYNQMANTNEDNTNTNTPIIEEPVLSKGDSTEGQTVVIGTADKLDIGAPKNEAVLSTENGAPFVTYIAIADQDANGQFIQAYYSAIANARYEEAYEMSKKSVDFETFKNWYTETTQIILDSYVPIDDVRSSLALTLKEGNHFTRYGVLMTLALENGVPIHVDASQVTILDEGDISDTNDITHETTSLEEEYGFFDAHQDTDIVISNENFQNITQANRTDYIVLDAREDIEYENGNFPNSTHIRFADLKAGRWIELPKDKYIYVLCWSGIRGKEVAEFLRTKKIIASYLEKGANGWVEFGGQWIGDIKFNNTYNEERFRIVFTTDETKNKVEKGVVLVDCREPQKFNAVHITGAYNIPIMYTPTTDLERVFAQVPTGSTVITVCDDYVNCFDAKITGVELERRGYTFIGRYNKPWEYDK